MAFEPFRFVHAADLRLDAPLVGCGRATEDIDRLADDATLLAFGHVADACLLHDAEFLLLTGPLWFDSLTPRAWNALAAGCASLAEFGIRVFWASGDPDAGADWRPMLAGLANLTALQSSDPDPVAIIREGRVIASLSTCDPRGARPPSATPVDISPVASRAYHVTVVPQLRASTPPPAPGAAPEVAVEEGLASLIESAEHLEIDYLALSSSSHRLLRPYASGLLHHPGSPQGVGPGESGPHGCSLIGVDSDGISHVEFLPTSVVRWEQLRAGVERGMSRPQLIDRMQQALLDRETSPGERRVCVHWLLTGSGPLFEELQTSGPNTELSAEIDVGLPACAELNRQHTFELRSRPGADDDAPVQDYLDVMDGTAVAGLAELPGLFEHHSAPHWPRHVIHSIERQNRSAVADTALRLGREWLQNQRHSGG